MRISIPVLLFGMLFSSMGLISSSAQAAIVDVDIVEFDFSPSSVAINLGDTVRWTNQGSISHSSTSDSALWDSGLLSPGQQFQHTFNAVGSFPYHCTPHPFMVGTVAVKPLLSADASSISASTGGVVNFTLETDPSLAGRTYVLLGSASGTTPGTPLPGGGVLPLNRGPIFQYILSNLNSNFLANFQGVFDASGMSTATLNIPFALPPVLPPGSTLHFAFTTTSPFDHQSEALPISIVP